MAEEIRSIEDREARIKEIDQRLAELDEEYADQQMPDHVRDEWNSINAERDEHAATVAELRARKTRLAGIAANQRGERAVTEVPAFIRQRGDDEIYDLASARFASRSDEEYRDRLHDNAKRVIERSTFPGSKKEPAQARAAELLDTIDDQRGTLARRIIATGSPLYERAFGKAVIARSVAGLTAEEQRAMSLSTDAEGGYAVPYQLDPTVILTDGGSTNPLRQNMARVERIVGKEWQGLTSDGVVATRTPEVAEATDADPDFEQPAARPSAVHVFVPFSMDLDSDWPRLRSELVRMFQRAKDNEEAESFINGDGALIPLGGHNPDGIVAGLPVESEVDDGGSFTSQTLYDLEAGENGLPPGFRANAQWLANKSVYNLVRQLGDTDGADLWVRLGAGMPPELIGYPAREASQMETTPVDRYLVLGDWQEYLIIDRIGMSVELVPHVFGAARRMPTGQRGIYARWRNTTKILVPNAFRVAVAGS